MVSLEFQSVYYRSEFICFRMGVYWREVGRFICFRIAKCLFGVKLISLFVLKCKVFIWNEAGQFIDIGFGIPKIQKDVSCSH